MSFNSNFKISDKVSLRATLLRNHFCGGSLLTNRFILTAAHCTTGLHAYPTFIVAVVGAVKRHFDGVTYRLDKIMRHEDFSMSTISNDISLLRTAQEIAFTDHIQPIALPTQDDMGNTQVIISGWGKTSAGNFLLPSTLQYAPVTTLSYEDCAKQLEKTSAKSFLKSYNICAVDKKGVGACNGDSGGPLVDPKNKVLLGVVSWGIPCGLGKCSGLIL